MRVRRIPGFLDRHERSGDRNDADRQIDQEGPAPRGVGRKITAEQRSHRAPGGGHRAPDAERNPAHVARERGRQQRQRRGRQHGRAHALDQAPGDHDAQARRKADDERAGDERDQAGDEHAAPSILVAQLAPGDDKGCKDQRIPGDDPFDLVELHVEVGANRRDRHIHHRDVDDGNQHRQTQHEQRQPLLATDGLASPVLFNHLFSPRSTIQLHTAYHATPPRTSEVISDKNKTRPHLSRSCLRKTLRGLRQIT